MSPTCSRIFADLFGHVAVHGPGGPAAADVQHEVGDHLVAVQGVVDLGMELEAVAAQLVAADGGEAVGRAALAQDGVAQFLEIRPHGGDRVEVAHPDLLDLLQTGEQGVLPVDVQIGMPPFLLAVDHGAAVVLGDFLVAETEAQDGNVQVVDLLVVGRILAEGRQGGAAGQDDALVLPENLHGVLGLADLGQHLAAAHLGGDEMGVLAAEIDDGDPVVLDIVAHGTVPWGWGANKRPNTAPAVFRWAISNKWAGNHNQDQG